MEERNIPTPASTLLELVQDMSSNDMMVRLVSIRELDQYDNDAVAIAALSSLGDNLRTDDNEVRVAAAIAVGRLGPSAQPVTQELIYMLQNDPYIHARDAAATALGLIEERRAIPYLAIALYDKNPYNSYNVPISSAISIARITGEKFTDFDSKTGFRLDENGVPLIVIDARKWWQDIGQFEDWATK